MQALYAMHFLIAQSTGFMPPLDNLKNLAAQWGPPGLFGRPPPLATLQLTEFAGIPSLRLLQLVLPLTKGPGLPSSSRSVWVELVLACQTGNLCCVCRFRQDREILSCLMSTIV